MVAPLQYGAGMKGKVTQSLAAGLPVVTTKLGAEGLNAVDGRDMFIEDDPQTFATRVIQLYGDDETWRAMSASGRSLVEDMCSPEIQRAALERLLAMDRSTAYQPA
jgi:glycosyltransferase involved in cell wall biosynthesis